MVDHMQARHSSGHDQAGAANAATVAMSTTAPPRLSYEEVERASATVVDMFAVYRHQMSSIESAAWVAAIETFSPAVVEGFCREWLVCAPTHRPPTLPDMRRVLDPTYCDSAQALEHLQALVGRHGSYQPPPPHRMKPALARAVAAMGGWVATCSAMPDRDDRFAWKAFVERFCAAFEGCEREAMRERALGLPGSAVPTLLGTHDVSRLHRLHDQAKLAAQPVGRIPAASALAQLSESTSDADAFAQRHGQGVIPLRRPSLFQDLA